MHICFISQEYPPETGWGGIGSYIYEMAHGLVRAGHRVSVIARATAEETLTDDRGVAVHRISIAPDWARYRGMWRLNHVWPGFAWAAMLRVRQIHARQPIDLIEASEGRADSFFLRWLPGRPTVIVRLHTARIFIDRLNQVQPDRRSRLSYWLERRAILDADALTAPSQAVADLTGTWLNLAQRPVAVIANPVDLAQFAPAATPRDNEVLFVGRLEHNKGMADLCVAIPEVLRRIPGSAFRLAGRESGQPWRERLLAPLSEAERARVHFAHIPRADLPQRYRAASVCVAPSIWENFPYVVLEAMSCATPVVATRAGGIPEIIEDGRSGVLVPAQQPRALADALCALLADPALCALLGRQARERVEELCATERIVPKMLDIYTAAALRRDLRTLRPA